MNRYRVNVEDLLDTMSLKQAEVCKKFGVTPYVVKKKETPTWYGFKDNKSMVLGVAHLDVVGGHPHPATYHEDGDLEFVIGRSVDDRVGAHVIGTLAKELGFDILFTTDEEKGNSTAQDFKTNKDYAWIFSFDRHGEDIVLYQYTQNYSWKQLIADEFKVTPSYGSYSDIADLWHLKCAGMNVGAGYHDEHMFNAYLDIMELESQVQKFKRFFRKYSETHYPCSIRKWDYGWEGSYLGDSRAIDDDMYYYSGRHSFHKDSQSTGTFDETTKEYVFEKCSICDKDDNRVTDYYEKYGMVLCTKCIKSIELDEEELLGNMDNCQFCGETPAFYDEVFRKKICADCADDMYADDYYAKKDVRRL